MRDRRFAGWTVHNTISAMLVVGAACGATIAVGSALSPEAARRNRISDYRELVEIERVVREPPDLTGLGSLFGVTTEIATADESIPPAHERAWSNYAPPALVGVGLLPGRRLAILKLASGQTRVFTEGQQWSEFTVVRILPHSVHLERMDSTRTILLTGPVR